MDLDYTQILKLYKELAMQYGFFTVSVTLTVCIVAIVFVLRLPAILHELNERRKIGLAGRPDKD